jgi:cyclopropane fatty-acyl-phospholipid synthase-like methyltransferase
MNDKKVTYGDLKLPPPELLYKVSRNSDQEIFLQSSDGQVAEMMQNLVAAGFNPEAKNLRLLDFGCGIGKVLVGMRKYPNISLFGCDLEQDLVDWCSTSYLKNKSRHLLENITYTGDGLNK